MPIGEDIPMLVPIAIILTVLILFLLSVFINMADQNEIVRMSQVSLNTIDYLGNVVFADEFGNLDYNKIDDLGQKSNCKGLDTLNITTNYITTINISDISTKEWWCWQNSDKTDLKTSITNIAPFVIKDNFKSDLGKVTIIVSK